MRDRSRENFARLYRQYGDALLRTAAYFTQGRQQDAEDIVQETWITAISQLPRFQGRSSFRSWITGILINKHREQERKYRRNELPEFLPAEATTPNVSHLAIDLKQAIMRLPDGYRQIITLHDLEGFKHHEIAQMLAIKDGTSKSQLFQARRAMRQLLTDYKEEPWKH